MIHNYSEGETLSYHTKEVSNIKHKQILALVLSVTLLLSCATFNPVLATQDEQVENTETTQPTQDTLSEEIQEPQFVNPDLFVQSDHAERLHADEGNDLNKLVFRNQDGSKTMYLYDHPVKYRDELGQTHDISLEIVDTEDSAYPFRTKANSVVTSFPASLSDGITLSGNGVTLRLVAPPPTGITALSHSARRVDKNTISYTYDSKTTIEYALTYTGFKEDIVVSEYTGQTEYPFILYTNGLNLTEIDGSYYLTDEAGTAQASIGDIIVFTADERNNTLGTLQATTIKPGQVYALTIVLDAEYLADPNTVYPIRIDPTVELIYTDGNPNAIEEKTIQSNNTPSGSSASIYVGYGASGINRLLMRFPGIDFDALEGVTVTSAVVSLRDLLCETEAMTVTCYPFTGTIWTESSSQWSNISQSWGTALSSKVISYDSGRQQESTHRYRFDITELAQKWVDGYADPARGVIFRASSSVESGPNVLFKTFASSERSSYRPIFEITYKYNGEPDQTTVDVDEGKTVTLTTSFPASQTVTWSSSDNSVATVSSSGVVTGIKAGQATITATCAEATAPVTYTVYVTVPDGVYYIQRAGSTKCLANEDSTVNSVSTHVESKNTSTVTDPTQFWQITYMTDGWYCIRPVDRIRAVLTMDNNNNVVVKDLSQGATVQIANRWQIIHESTGYVFLHRGLSSTVMTAIGLSEGANVTLASKTANNSCHWTLSEAQGVVLRDTTTQRAIPSSTTKTIEMGDTVTLPDLGISCEFYGIQRNISWTSSSSWTAHANSTTGAVTGISAGFTVISGIARDSESAFYVHYAVEVLDNYVTQLVSDFGFTYENALLIESVYSRICAAYPNDNSMMWAWRTARVLGGIVYGDGITSAIKWYDVAGIPFTCGESDFYTEVLNFSQDEYMRLSSAIATNHNSEHADFAHMQISLAARLAYHLHKTGILSNVYTLSSDENVSFLAGWLGDATIIGDDGTTSFGNDDYHADLDAENIYQLIQSGSSYINACNQYYASLTSKLEHIIFCHTSAMEQ